ncbi:MAG TPA: hypothetical protein VLQ52_04165, partial [Coriobacteriia bacterium]|nr:hypothetical protein [Coriobacteriia bacterium]
VALINADPDAYRALLAEQARLPEPLKDTYRVSTYPLAAPPTAAAVDPVLAWMAENDLLQGEVKYADLILDLRK